MTTVNPMVLDEEVEEAARWAVHLAESQTPGERSAELDAWLEASPRHGVLLDEIVGAWRSVEDYAAHEEIIAMREAALASARRQMRQRGKKPRLWSRVPVMIAAGFALLVVAVGVTSWLSPQTYTTDVGERRVAVLSDGSKLSLDGATQVQVKYSDQRRQLWLLSGRARFDVAKDPSRPFIVRAADKDVVATGTAFSVERIQQQVRVVLYEGKVALLEAGNVTEKAAPIHIGATSAEKLLAPGHEIVLPEHSAPNLTFKVASLLVADPVRSAAWEEGQLVFEDEPLALVVERMNRYAGKPLVIGDAAAGALRISGVFRAGDTEGLVQGLAAGFGVKSRDDQQFTVLFGPTGSTPPA